MYQMNIPAYDPKRPESIRLPMVYVKESVKWEYKQIVRNLEEESPLGEAELNGLGEASWELLGIAQQPPLAYFYFKRTIEK
jgi:hypothetical protein